MMFVIKTVNYLLLEALSWSALDINQENTFQFLCSIIASEVHPKNRKGKMCYKSYYVLIEWIPSFTGCISILQTPPLIIRNSHLFRTGGASPITWRFTPIHRAAIGTDLIYLYTIFNVRHVCYRTCLLLSEYKRGVVLPSYYFSPQLTTLLCVRVCLPCVFALPFLPVDAGLNLCKGK